MNRNFGQHRAQKQVQTVSMEMGDDTLSTLSTVSSVPTLPPLLVHWQSQDWWVQAWATRSRKTRSEPSSA